ncbi:hypothetical protein HPB49_004256 [Dermacentor silvarum]|uniref:Uncharacterized protein n=1 Tax=Dermacentor silvarum TaxID=543639 RepID=A0ACB8DVA1_DERSI|nr:hypothetical protein HPB49_004256 [Dermacentor silvarum]
MVANGLYTVPSASCYDIAYQILADIGMCTFSFGKQGAFCKHQAVVHTNAPPLSTEDRHQLGKRALGDKCPSRQYFMPFQGVWKVPDDDSCASQGPSTPQASCSSEGLVPSSPPLTPPVVQEPDEVQLAQGQEDAYQSLEVHLRRVHALNEHDPAYLEILQGLGDELDRVQNGGHAAGLMLAFKATAAARRRKMETDGARSSDTMDADASSSQDEEDTNWFVVDSKKKRLAQAASTLPPPPAPQAPRKTNARLPQLPIDDYKIVFRPRDGLNLGVWPQPSVARTIAIAAGWTVPFSTNLFFASTLSKILRCSAHRTRSSRHGLREFNPNMQSKRM